MIESSHHAIHLSDAEISSFVKFCGANGYSQESTWVALLHLALTRFSLKESLTFKICGHDGVILSEKLGSEDSFRDLTKKYSEKSWKRNTIPAGVQCTDFKAEFEIEKAEEGYELRIRCEDCEKFPAILQTFSEVLHALIKTIPYYHKKNVFRIPCLTKKALRAMSEFGKGEKKDVDQRSLGEIFFQVAEKNRDHVAILSPDQSITYGDLVKKVENIAGYLGQKYQSGAHIGIVADRSIEVLTSILGVWAANLSYVPVDPESPEKRREYITTNANIPEFSTADVPIVSPAPFGMGRHVSTSLASDPVAYMMYTSGSTGKPKGCEVSQGSVKNLLLSLDEKIYKKFPGVKRVALNAPLTFDASVQQILTLLLGKTLVLLNERIRRDGDAMALYLGRQEVDLLDLTPSHYKLLFKSDEFAKSEYPKIILLGGEKIDSDLISSIREGGRTCFNVYGLTETTVNVTIGELTSKTCDSYLGRPIFNSILYVSDPDMNLVPIGMPGELMISGLSLARSYWKSETLTQERFVSNPWGNDGNGRPQGSPRSKNETIVFRTGDLVKFNEDGSLQFIGRIDDQVKVRGHRVQLSEVEANIRAMKSVVDVAVISQENQEQGLSLHAFVIQGDHHQTSDEDILKLLSDFLPMYAVPSTCTTVKEFPLLPSRKVDRMALLKLKDGQVVASADSFPTSRLEEELVQLWRKNLRVDKVGIDSNYFECGGHSLLAAQLMSEVNTRYGLKLSVGILYLNPTVRDLARSILAESEKSEFRHLVRIGEGANQLPPIFCFHPAGGNAYFYKDAFTVSQLRCEEVWCVQSGALDGSDEYRTPHEFTKNYTKEILRALSGRHQCHVLGWSLGGLLAFDVANSLETYGVDVLTIDLWDSGKIRHQAQPTPDWGQGYLNTVKTLLGREQQTLSSDEEKHIRSRVEDQGSSEFDQWLLHWLRTEKKFEFDLSPRLLGNSAKLTAFHDFLFQSFTPPKVHSSVYAIWASDEEPAEKRPWQTNTIGPYREDKVMEDHFSMVGKHNLPKLRSKFMGHVERARRNV